MNLSEIELDPFFVSPRFCGGNPQGPKACGSQVQTLVGRAIVLGSHALKLMISHWLSFAQVPQAVSSTRVLSQVSWWSYLSSLGRHLKVLDLRYDAQLENDESG